MPLGPGQPFYATFTTINPTTGGSQNADSLPTGLVVRNGVDDNAVSVTITPKTTGRYLTSGTIPSSYLSGDSVDIVVFATVASVSGTCVVATYLIAINESGQGGIVVDQDYPTTGNLQYEYPNGVGIAGGTILAYVASEWAANPLTAAIRGQATTGNDGSWLSPMTLSAASYTFVFNAPGYVEITKTLAVS